MDRLLRMLSVLLIVSFLATSMHAFAVETGGEMLAEIKGEESEPADGDAYPENSEEISLEEAFAHPVEAVVFDEAPEMDLMEATDLMPELFLSAHGIASEEGAVEFEEEPGMDLMEVTDPMPELFLSADGAVSEAGVVMPNSVYVMSSGETADIAVELPVSALPVASAEGLENGVDYRNAENGVVLLETWLEQLAPGETVVRFIGADGIEYVLPVVVMEEVYNAAETEYDADDLKINGESVGVGVGKGWEYSLSTGELILSADAEISGNGTIASIDASGSVTVSGKVTVDAVGAFAVRAADMTISEGASLTVRAASAVQTFAAVDIGDTLVNNGSLEIEILPGKAVEAYGVRTTYYQGANEKLKITNSQTHKGVISYGAYAQAVFDSNGSCVFVNYQPGENVTGVYACQWVYLYDFDAQTKAEVTNRFRGAESGSTLEIRKGGTVNVCMDNAVGQSSDNFYAGSAAIYGYSVYNSADILVTGQNASNVCGVYASYNVGNNGDIDIEFENCIGDVCGIYVFGACADFSDGARVSIHIAGGDYVYGLVGYSVNVYADSSVEIVIKDAAKESWGLYDRSGCQTHIIGSLNIRVYGNSDTSKGVYGNIYVDYDQADIYVCAPCAGLNSFQCIDNTANEQVYLDGFLLEYKSGKLKMVKDYLYLEVNGKNYSVYPEIMGASGTGWNYNKDTGILTLKGFVGESIICPKMESLNVVLSGVNSLGIFDSYADKTVFTGSGSLKVDGFGLDSMGGLFGEHIVLNGGTYSIENCDNAIWGEKVEIDAANITVDGASIGVRSGGVLSISKNASLDIDASYRALTAVGACTLNGKALEKATCIMKIKDGIVVESSDEKTLHVGGKVYSAEELLKDLNAKDWTWNAEKQQLVLEGYEGMISCSGGILNLYVKTSAMLSGLYADVLSIDGVHDGEIVTDSLNAAELTLENASLAVSGSKSATVGKLAVKSGNMIADNVKAEGEVRISGGQLIGDNVWAKTIYVSGGTLALYADSSLEAETVYVAGGLLTTTGTVECTDYSQTGGEAEICLNAALAYNRFDWLMKAQKVSITGGSFKAANFKGKYVFDGEDVSIGGKASSVLYSNERIASAKSMSVCGVSKSVYNIRVFKIEKGACEVFAAEQDTALLIDTPKYIYRICFVLADNFVLGDDTWTWDFESETLVMNGFNGGFIYVGKGDRTKLYLMPGTLNKLSSSLDSGGPDIVVCGSGLFQGDINMREGDLTFDNCGVISGKMTAQKGDIKLNTVRMVDGSLWANNGSIWISDSNVTCREVFAAADLHIEDSMLEGYLFSMGTTEADISCGKKATINNSILMYGKYKAKGGTSRDKYSALFKWGQKGYTLEKNVTLKQDWTLPDRPFYIPKGKTLKINSGKTLYYMGSLKKKGKVSGKTKASGIPDSFMITGKHEMATGTSQTLILTSSPASANKEALWMTDLPGYCSVNRDGKITIENDPLLVGETITVVASSLFSENCYATFEISIHPGASKVAVVKDAKVIDSAELWLDPANKTMDLNAEVSPSNASQQVSWMTTNKKVATVDKNGLVTAKAAGSCYVYAASADGTDIESQRIKVTVKKAPKSVKLSSGKATLAYDAAQKMGTQKQLNVKLSSGSASTIKYTSSNTKVAVVDENGLVTAVGRGTAKIKASTYNKKSATCTVTVKAAPTSMVFSKTAYKVAIDDTINVSAEPNSKAYTPTVVYGSENAGIAGVDSVTGTVKPSAFGSTRIFTKAFNGVTGYAELSVVDVPEMLSLNASSKSLKVGKKFTIKPTVTRKDGKDTVATYTFKSSKPSVCKVSASGKVTAKKKGTAVITVTTHNGLTAKVKIKVK